MTLPMTFVGANPMKMRALVMSPSAYHVISRFMRIHSTPDIDQTFIRFASREEFRDLNVVLKETEIRCDKENSEILEL